MLDSGKVKIDIDPSMAGRVEVVFDFGCGTATSCILYYLLFYPRSICIGVDRGLDDKWVREHLPPAVRSRFFFFNEDVGKLTMEKLEEMTQKAANLPVTAVTRAHWSPSCKGNSRASRGFHRDAFGNPKTDLAREDDAIFEYGCLLMQQLHRKNPNVCITIENPYSEHFPHLPGSRLLLKDYQQWRLLCGSHCSNLCPADTGYWPQKDTFVITSRVLRKFHLDLCDFDCKHLLPLTNRHRCVLCHNDTNLDDQLVITDEYMKGLIPLGYFRKIDLAHRAWCARRDARLTRVMNCVLTPAGEIASRRKANATSKEADHESDSDEEASDDSESEPDSDSEEYTFEDDYDDDGNKVKHADVPLREVIYKPHLPLGDSPVHAHALCYPALIPGQPRWQVDYLYPGQLWFADLVTFDFQVRGAKASVLLAYDLVTDGVRVQTVKRKACIGEAWDKIVTKESLDKRDYKVTVVTDGCGAMHGILAEHAYQRGIDHLPLVPNQPHLNNVEGIVASFKADVATCLLAACADEGPLSEAHILLAIEYVAYTRERFVPTRSLSALKTDMTRYECNTGVPPKPGLVPFGTPGFCFVPPKLRSRRKAPKYERAEPVLMVGNQHMYNNVYRCLTRHNTIVSSEQIFWNLKAPLGIYLEGRPYDPIAKLEVPLKESTRQLLEDDIFAGKLKATAEKAEKKSSSLPPGILRLNKAKVFDSNGLPRPKPYIYDRIKAVEGLSIAEASQLEFPDKHGNPSTYKRDVMYDVFVQKWLRIESSHDAARAAASAAHVGRDAVNPQEANSFGTFPLPEDRASPEDTHKEQPCFFKSVYGDQVIQHPDGSFGTCMNRHRRRVVRRTVLRACRRGIRASYRSAIDRPRKSQVHRFQEGRRSRLAVDPSHSDADSDVFLDVPSPDGPNALSPDEARFSCNIAMRDLPWQPYLVGKEKRHREDILRAHKAELDSLCSPVLRELKPGDDEYDTAVKTHTTCRAILEWKRQGLWKVRVVIQGFKENLLALDGPDFQYSSDVVGLTAIRALFLNPLKKGEAIGQLDISTAFLQADLFPPETPPRYLMLDDPVTGTKRYFRQLGVVYGSASSSKRWQDTLHSWLVKPEAEGGGGYEEGKNDPCLFYHNRLGVSLATYVDDMAVRGARAQAEEAFQAIQARFKCKSVHWLTRESALDHLGMTFFQTDKGTYLSMENYIEAMVVRLGLKVDFGRHQKLPMSAPITDYTPLSKDDAKWFQSATGMLGWLAGTGRCDVKLCHSRISAYMANPCKGALKAALQAVTYCAHNKDLCLFQPFEGSAEWVHFSDSDHAGNSEPGAKRKSQLGYVSMCGRAPIGWGSKSTSVNFDDRLAAIAESCTPSRNSPWQKRVKIGDPTCHRNLQGLHPDMSSGAAEIYAASVSLTEILHLSYLMEEMGHQMDPPFRIKVDNTAAIAFSEGKVRKSKLKHIDVRQQWVEWLRDRSLVKLEYVNTKLNLADFYTKILDTETFENLRDQQMVRQPLPPAAAA